jgi:hypothetical protein
MIEHLLVQPAAPVMHALRDEAFFAEAVALFFAAFEC